MDSCKTFFNWSSGKDSALALYYLMQDPSYRIDYLLTTINEPLQRVTMHGTRVELLQKQIASIGIAGELMGMPAQPSNSDYEALTRETLGALADKGYACAAYGDIFLEDLREYREQQLLPLNLKAVFPLWGKDTSFLIKEFLSLGFKAVTVAVSGTLLGESFLGRELDENFWDDLPEGVDPCGENGEFHTFCYDGPIFSQPIPFTIGDSVYREYQNGEAKSGFWFCDVLPNYG